MRFSGRSGAFFLVLFYLGAGQASAAGLFLSPGMNYADHQGSSIAGGAGSMVALGLTWGATLSHEADLVWSRSPWTMGDEAAGAVASGGNAGGGDAISLLASYCYYFGHSTDRIRPYLGFVGGTTNINGRIETALSGIAYAGLPREWVASYGTIAGITLALGRIVSVDLGYRYLHSGGVDYDTTLFGGSAGFTSGPGPRARFDDLKSHAVSLSLKIRL